MDDNTSDLRKKNLAKFEDFQSSSPSTNQPMTSIPGIGSDLDEQTSVERAGRSFGEAGMIESPFKNDHFNSKLLGFDLGKVMDPYDKNSYLDPFNKDIDFDALRSEKQSFVTQGGALAAQFVGKTAVGTVGNIIGGFYSLGKAIQENDINQMMDNDFYRGLDKMNESIEAANTMFVNPKDGIGLNANMFKGIADAYSFIAGAAVSEIAMQTAGNLVGGAGLATLPGRALRYMSGMRKLYKMFDKSKDAIINAKRTEQVGQAALELGKTVDKMSSMVLLENATASLLKGGRRMLTSTGYEASLEARGTKDDYMNSMISEMEYYLERADMSEEEKEAYRQKKLVQFTKDADAAGMMTFAANTALLSVSNAMQFPQIFGSSFIKGAKIGGVVRDGIAQVAKSNVKNSALKNILSSTGRILKNPATELTEEMLQGVASNYSKNHYEIMLGDKTQAGVLAPRMNGVADSMFKALGETYGTADGWHEGIIGGIVGFIGIPGMKKKGKGFKGTWSGGLYGTTQEMKQERKEREEALVRLNERKPSDLMEHNVTNAIRGSLNSQQEDISNIAGNKIAFESVRDNRIFQYTTDRLAKGLGDFITEDIQEMKDLANNNIEKYQEAFSKGKDFTKEQALEEVDNFEKTVDTYKEAYRKVHQFFNVDLMSPDKDTKKLVDTLTYAVATEKMTVERINKIQNFLYDMRNANFTSEEVESLVKGSKEYGAIASKFDAYVAKKDRERGIITPKEAKARRAEIKSKIDKDFEHLLEEDTTKLEKELAKLKEKETATDPEVAEKDAELIATYESVLAEKEAYEAIALDEKLSDKITRFNPNRSEDARDLKKEIEAFLESEKINVTQRSERAMQEISRPKKVATAEGMSQFLFAKSKFAADFNATISAQSVFDRDANGYDDAKELLNEVYELSDRLVTATNVAGYLYGFKKSPHKALNSIKAAQFWADLDNVEGLATELDMQMQDNDLDAEFRAKFNEFDELMDTTEEGFTDLQGFLEARFPKDVYAQLLQDIENLQVKRKKFEEFIGTKEARDKQQAEIVKKSKEDDKKTKTNTPSTSTDNEMTDEQKALIGNKLGKVEKGAPKKTPTGTGTSSESPEGGDGKAAKTTPAARKAIDRDVKNNALSIREMASFTRFQPTFAPMLERGEFKDKAAVTLNLQDKTTFDPEKNIKLKEKLIRDSNWQEQDSVSLSDVALLDKEKKSAIEEAEADVLVGAVSIKVLASNENKDGMTMSTILVKKEDGSAVQITTELKNKPDYLASYIKGLQKFNEDVEVLRVNKPEKLDWDVYNFIRYVPMSMHVYDKKVELNDKGEYDFDLKPEDKSIYDQEHFFSADDILRSEAEASRRYGELQDKQLKLREDRKKELSGVTKGTKHTTALKSKINNKFDKLEKDAEDQYMASANNGHSNFNYRHTLLRRMFVAKEPAKFLKLKIQNVDQGNLQKHDHVNDTGVLDHNPRTLGFDPKEMTLDDIWFGNQHRSYIRIDGKPSYKIDGVDPFVDMHKAQSKAMYFMYKNKAGKKIPVKMNTPTLSQEFIKAILDQMDKYWASANPEAFVVKNTGIPVLDGMKGLNMEEFLSFFMQKQGDHSSTESAYMKNVVNFYEKDGKSTMSFRTGESKSITVTNEEDYKKARDILFDRLGHQRFFPNRKFLVNESPDGNSLRKDVLEYYFDKGLITHSFDVQNNFDKVYDRTIDGVNKYNRGIKISLAETKDSKSKVEKIRSFNQIYSQLKKAVSSNNKEPNMRGMVDHLINDVVSRVSKSTDEFVKKNVRKPDDAEIDEMISEAVEYTVEKQVSKIKDAVALKPNMLRGVNHETDFKIKSNPEPGVQGTQSNYDRGFDKLLRMTYAFRAHAKETGFRKSIANESKLWGSRTTLANSFKNAKTPVQFNTYRNAQDKLGDLPSSQMTSEKQFLAAMTAVNKLKELTDSGREVHIKYTEDFSENKGGPRPWSFSKKDKNDKITNKHIKSRVYHVIISGNPSFDVATGKVVGGSVQLQVGQMKKDEKGAWVPGRNMITLLQNSEEAYPRNNIVTSMYLPFTDVNLNTTDGLAELDADADKRAEIRALNAGITESKVLNKLGEDFLALEKKDVEQDQKAYVDMLSQDDSEDGGKKEPVKQNPNDTIAKPPAVMKSPEAYLKDDNLLAIAMVLEMEVKKYNKGLLSKKELESLGEFIIDEFQIDSAEQFVYIMDLYNENKLLSGVEGIKDFAKDTLETLCKK